MKIDRKLLDSKLWLEKPFDKAHAWADLIGLANWKDSEVLDGYDTITIRRGEVARSQQWLADRWGWSRKKVIAFTSFLEREGAITKKGTTKGTTLYLENYNKYQGEGTAEDTAEEQPRIQQRNSESTHIKNNKKNNNKKNFIKRDIRETGDLIEEAHQRFQSIKESLLQA